MNEKHPIHEEKRLVSEDRRQEPETSSPNRRSGDDRRRLQYGVLYKTGDSLLTLEDWLDSHCRGNWAIAITEISEDLSFKTIQIMFEQAEDKELFKKNAGRI